MDSTLELSAALLISRSSSRHLSSNRTLEPTQVAGFNQFFDDPNGNEVGAAIGVGLDWQTESSMSVYGRGNRAKTGS